MIESVVSEQHLSSSLSRRAGEALQPAHNLSMRNCVTNRRKRMILYMSPSTRLYILQDWCTTCDYLGSINLQRWARPGRASIVHRLQVEAHGCTVLWAQGKGHLLIDQVLHNPSCRLHPPHLPRSLTLCPFSTLPWNTTNVKLRKT